MPTVKTVVTRNRFEPISDDEDASNEITYPTNRGHSTTEVNSQDKKSKFNRTGKKNSKGTAPIPRHNTVDTEQNGITSEHREENNPSRTIIIAGDSILKHLNAHKMSKDNNKVKVATFPGCTIRDMRDHIKPILRKKPDQLIIHVGTNSLRESESPSACSDEIINLVSPIKRDATDTDVVLSSLTARSDDGQLAIKVEDVNSTLRDFCCQNKWKIITHSNIVADHHLNRSGLHLNRIGTSRLARNFVDFIAHSD